MNGYENKIELMNYLNVFWKRKWFIIIATFLIIATSAVISFLMPPKWEVDAIIVPSKFISQTGEGIFRENLFVPSQVIVSLINQATYNNLIATELSLDIKDFPKIKAENLKNTNLVRVSIKEKDVEKAKLILHSLCNHLKRKLDIHANFKKKGIDTQIKSKEKEKLILERKIKAYKNKLNIIKQRKQEIEKEMSDIKNKIEELKKERRLILKKKDRSEFESLATLHYSNEIQHNSINYRILNESLGKNKIEEEIINLEIEDKEMLINQIENELNDLNKRKSWIRYAQLTKEPTSSISPVSPKKLLNVLIAAPLGFIIFTILAFFFEYLEKQKAKSKE
jgi:capsular polysaccharide biosynthesis protein